MTATVRDSENVCSRGAPLRQNACSENPATGSPTVYAWHVKAAVDEMRRTELHKEQLREILERQQINVVRTMLMHWCSCAMRPKIEPMKDVAALARRQLEGIVAWASRRQTNGFLEAIDGLFQAAKREPPGLVRQATIKAAAFLIVGKLDFQAFSPHARQPT